MLTPRVARVCTFGTAWRDGGPFQLVRRAWRSLVAISADGMPSSSFKNGSGCLVCSSAIPSFCNVLRSSTCTPACACDVHANASMGILMGIIILLGVRADIHTLLTVPALFESTLLRNCSSVIPRPSRARVMKGSSAPNGGGCTVAVVRTAGKDTIQSSSKALTRASSSACRAPILYQVVSGGRTLSQVDIGGCREQY